MTKQPETLITELRPAQSGTMFQKILFARFAASARMRLQQYNS